MKPLDLVVMHGSARKTMLMYLLQLGHIGEVCLLIKLIQLVAG